MNIIPIPLKSLRLSEHNARKTGGQNVQDLAASIMAHGLLQNLTAIDAGGGHFDVIAGGRRLRALQLLQERGDLPDALSDIPCRILTNGEITEVSVAENTIRENMHPADQFEAFRAMVENNKPITDVAAHFGVTELVVQRRMRLANAAPELLHAFRNDKLTLEQMMAFALTDDRAAQLRHWQLGISEPYQLRPENIRRALTQREIPSTDKRVRFIGLDAYADAGGAVRRDLFDDQGGGYVLDEALLDRLVAEKLQAESERLAAEGWSFVRVDASDDYNQFRYSCNQSQPKSQARVLSEEDTQYLSQLNARNNELREKIEALEEQGEYPDDDDPLSMELEDVEYSIKKLREPIETWTTRQMANAGALVAIDYRGNLEVFRGLIPTQGGKADKALATDKGEKPAPKEPTLAESMVRRLTAHRTIALQAALMKNADIALAAVAHALLTPLLFDRHDYIAPFTALNIRATAEIDQPEKYGFEDVSKSPHHAHTVQALAELNKTLGVPGKRAEFWPWLLLQKRDVICALLASVAVLTVQAVQGEPGPHPSDALIEALDVDMADTWKPTAENFFNLVPRSLAIEALEEACGKNNQLTSQLQAGARYNKAELAGACEQYVFRTGWLPKVLRRKGYALRNGTKAETPAAAKDEAKPKAKAKPAAKKPVKKAPTKKKPPAKAKKSASKKAAKK
jgi:ParB family chromosome partitioning protein